MTRWKLGVEPTMFFYMLAYMLTSVVEEDLIVYKACSSTHNYSEDICRNISQPEYQDQKRIVQVTVSWFHMWENIASHAIPAVLALFLGSWSDRVGRKIPLIMGLFGGLVYSSAILVNSFMDKWRIEWILLTGALPCGLTGGPLAVFMAAFSYLSDTTSSEARTYRTTLLEVSYLITMPTGVALGSYLFNKVFNRSHGIMFSLNCICLIISIVYSCIALERKTTGNSPNRPDNKVFDTNQAFKYENEVLSINLNNELKGVPSRNQMVVELYADDTKLKKNEKTDDSGCLNIAHKEGNDPESLNTCDSKSFNIAQKQPTSDSKSYFAQKQVSDDFKIYTIRKQESGDSECYNTDGQQGTGDLKSFDFVNEPTIDDILLQNRKSSRSYDFVGSGMKDKYCFKGRICISSFVRYVSQHVSESVKTLIRPRSGQRRKLLYLCFLALALYTFQREEKHSIYLYTQLRFNWDVATFSVFRTYQSSLYIIGLLVGVPLLNKIFGIRDTVIMMIGSVSHIAARTTFSLADNPNLIYLGGTLGLLGPIVAPVIRSSVSKLVPSYERGKVFAWLSVCDMAVPLVSGALYSSVYSQTLTTFPQAVFILTILSQIVVLSCAIWMESILKNKPIKQQKDLSSFEKQKS